MNAQSEKGYINVPENYHRLTKKQCEDFFRIAAQSLAYYAMKHRLKSYVLGISGGKDSTIKLSVAKKAEKYCKSLGYKLTIIPVILPCDSDPEDERLGRLAVEHYGATDTLIYTDLTASYEAYTKLAKNDTNAQVHALLQRENMVNPLNNWDRSVAVTKGNGKAQFRMTILYGIANQTNGAVLSTDNLSEYIMGFWTLHGDVGDVSSIQFIFKTEVIQLLEYDNAPQEIIDAESADGLKIAGNDEQQLGMKYHPLDFVMIYLIQQGFDYNGEMSQLDDLASARDKINNGIVDINLYSDAEQKYFHISKFIDLDRVEHVCRQALITKHKRGFGMSLQRSDFNWPEIDQIQLRMD